ncbi:MAG: heat-inducible transcriptional repressor HrcA [Alphaproteobacteria bacterium]
MSRPLNEGTGIAALDQRSRDVFRHIVETYLETGEPVGSRLLSRQLPMTLSPASVRNVMQDLEVLGLITSPHISAGRVPTQHGLRLFVDALLEIGDLNREDRAAIEAQAKATKGSFEDALAEAGNLLSGLSQCAGVVLATKTALRIKHMEFVGLDANRALAVLVGEDGTVENRILQLPAGLTPSALAQAANYLNHHMRGLSLDQARTKIEVELVARRTELDSISKSVIEAGVAIWSEGTDGDKMLVVRGRSHLLSEDTALEDIDRIQHLFDDMENKRDLIQLLGLAEKADGVRIFIGSENNLFSMSASSLVVAPYRDNTAKVVGVLGVIGPTRLNYARIIPMVDYTARMMERVLS